MWTVVAAFKTLATLMTRSSQKWMDWGWSPWKRVEARVVGVVLVRVEVVGVMVVRRPRPKLGLRVQALRTLPWKKKNKVGPHPVQLYLQKTMAPARLRFGATYSSLMRGFLSTMLGFLELEIQLDRPIGNCPSFSQHRGQDLHYQPKTQELPLAS